jgi:hypothetical protein
MKLYFEEGKLKLYIGEEATEQRRKFLHDTYYIFRDWDKDNPYTQIVQVEGQYKYIIKEAKRHGVDITQDVEDYYQYLLQKEEEDRKRKARMEAQQRAIEKGDFKQTNGCGWCEYLEYTPAHIEFSVGERKYISGQHTCSYAKRACRYRSADIEYQFEISKEIKAFGAPIDESCRDYVAKPYPCAGCKYLEESRKAWEEINKERETQNV